MTKEELTQALLRRKLGETQRAVVVVKDHKTGALKQSLAHIHFVSSHFLAARKEAALLVIDSSSLQMALLWVKILGTLPDCSHTFPELDRSPLQHLNRKIAAAAMSVGAYTAYIHRLEEESRNS